MPPAEIQWCDHSYVVLEYLRQLYEEGGFVDVGLECEGRTVKAHKAVISACSPYLERLLKGNPARSHLIKLNGYSATSLKSVIDFMYNGKVIIEQENLAAFLKLGRALQVRGILNITQQCEEYGLTTPDETKSNAQYSTSVQQQNKNQPIQKTETKKQFGYISEKNALAQKKGRKTLGGLVMGNSDQNVPRTTGSTVQTAQQQATTQETTLEELQQALSSGQALLQSDPNDPNSGDQTLQMMEGQCVVTGSGETYVVVQDGENVSLVPAEMVQGDLAAVNGGQVIDSLNNVEQELAQMETQVMTTDGQVLDAGQIVTTSADSGNIDTLDVVESLVKLGQKQPEETPEVGADMPSLDVAREEQPVVEEKRGRGVKRKAAENASYGKKAK